MPLKRLLGLNWEAIAGVLAALAALILHLLHLVDEGVLLSIALVLLALLLIRDLRRESNEERLRVSIGGAEVALRDIGSALRPPEAILVGPADLSSSTEQFVGRIRGEVIWFNVCLLMFRPQQTFDMLLRPIIENPLVSSVRFLSRHSEKELWQIELMSKVAACSGSHKVKEPEWHELAELPGADEAPLVPPMVTLLILGGRKEKIRPGDVLGALTGEAGFTREQVGKITVTDQSTYVAVARNIAHEAVRKLSAGKLKGKTVKVRAL